MPNDPTYTHNYKIEFNDIHLNGEVEFNDDGEVSYKITDQNGGLDTKRMIAIENVFNVIRDNVHKLGALKQIKITTIG